MIDLEEAAAELEEYAAQNGSTSERGIEQEDGSILVLRSTQGEPCEQLTYSAEEREDKGWPPLQEATEGD